MILNYNKNYQRTRTLPEITPIPKGKSAFIQNDVFPKNFVPLAKSPVSAEKERPIQNPTGTVQIPMAIQETQNSLKETLVPKGGGGAKHSESQKL